MNLNILYFLTVLFLAVHGFSNKCNPIKIENNDILGFRTQFVEITYNNNNNIFAKLHLFNSYEPKEKSSNCFGIINNIDILLYHMDPCFLNPVMNISFMNTSCCHVVEKIKHYFNLKFLGTEL